MTRKSKRENREIPRVSAPHSSGGERSENASGRTADMHAGGKSDGPTVPAKLANKADPSAAESVEERGPAKGNIDQPTAYRTPCRNKRASRGLIGVREAAERDGTLKFTAVLHHVGVELLRSSFYELKRNAVPGVAAVTWREYEQGLETRLVELHARVHRGTYRAWPSKRVIRGWQNYYAVPFSPRRQTQFLRAVTRHWLGTIRRRSQKVRDRWSWFRMLRLATRWHPRPRIIHPHERLRVQPEAGAV